MPQSSTLARGELDRKRLAGVMKALSNPVRIELLQVLQRAHTLGEIRLEAGRRDSAARSRRPINRVTTRRHLDLLLELGMVRGFRRVRDGRALDHYLVNHAQLFALIEELRQLAFIRPQDEAIEGTVPAPSPSALALDGPRLALVNGLGEGRVFPLAGLYHGLVGRKPGAAVCLEYDPFVSLQNTGIERRGNAVAVRDLGSRNGTFVNWERLKAGEWRPLRSGDVLGVGRSLLSFRA